MNIKFENNPNLEDLINVVSYVNQNLDRKAFPKIATNEPLTHKHAKLWLKKYLLKEQIYSIAFMNGSIVGASHVDVFHGRRKHGGKLAITVDSEYRGKGIGELLLKDIINQCNLNGVFLIRAEPTEDNLPMINLLKKNGFIFEGKCTKAFHCDSGGYLDLFEFISITRDI
jgi:ribosomal protein S18 acetylase RimI-like enzyme